MFSPLTNLSWPDVADVLFLSVVAYYLYLWFRGTKALRAIIGLVVLGVCYSLARFWGLFLTTWVFQVLWQVLVILVLILFQNEIRQVLERVNPLKPWLRREKSETLATIQVVARLARDLAARGWGGLVVFKRRQFLAGLSDEGLTLDADVSLELLESIFNPKAPAHDGAVIIESDRAVRMGAVLPLSARQDLPSYYGTRHRAALGLSEVCDAIVVAVSEERREISLAVEGKLKKVKPEMLDGELAGLLHPVAGPSVKGLALVKRLVLANWPIKLGSLFLVAMVWLVLAGQQNFQVSLQVPVTYAWVESGLEVGELSDREVKLDLTGPRRQASSVRTEDVKVVVSLSGLEVGDHQISLIRQNIQVPLGLEVARVSPRVLRVILQKRG